MQNNFLVDTNVIIDGLRKFKAAVKVLESLEVVNISIATAYELIEGCRNLSELVVVEELLEGYNILPITEEISKSALEFLVDYKLSNGIETGDCLIAATAILNDLTLLTSNVKHFNFIEELRVRKPF